MKFLVCVLYVGNVWVALGSCKWVFWYVCCMSVMSMLQLGDASGVFGVCCVSVMFWLHLGDAAGVCCAHTQLDRAGL